MTPELNQDDSTATEERMRQMKEMAAEKAQHVDAFAREHVWKTVGVAAAAAFIVGMALSKKQCQCSSCNDNTCSCC